MVSARLHRYRPKVGTVNYSIEVLKNVIRQRFSELASEHGYVEPISDELLLFLRAEVTREGITRTYSSQSEFVAALEQPFESAYVHIISAALSPWLAETTIGLVVDISRDDTNVMSEAPRDELADRMLEVFTAEAPIGASLPPNFAAQYTPRATTSQPPLKYAKLKKVMLGVAIFLALGVCTFLLDQALSLSLGAFVEEWWNGPSSK